MSSRNVEDIYKKMTAHEHILARPDMYIGTIENVTDDLWVYNDEQKRMELRKCQYIPGLYKIFDEILVNAADNKVRDPRGQTVIKVWIGKDCIQVYNNGEGIPIELHSEHNIYIPEMIFGHLLTSSNYNDQEVKITGGRNGYGAKLTNVFSTIFEVETVSAPSKNALREEKKNGPLHEELKKYTKRKFRKIWRSNMTKSEAHVISGTNSEDYTSIKFYPDFGKFKLSPQEFNDDIIAIMKRRVFDIAGCTDESLSVFLNGEKIPCANFRKYIQLYPTRDESNIDSETNPIGGDNNDAAKTSFYSKVNNRWEIGVRVSDIGFQQVSFVNSIATTRGGTHVKYIMEQIVQKVTEQARRKLKVELKPHMIRPHLFLFINSFIENPAFDSQTKETLNTVKSKFGSECELPANLIDSILKCGIIERAVASAHSKLTNEIASKTKNSDRRVIHGIPKLDDANEAGGKYSSRCTLILTEGDSAKALCTAGLAVKDRDFFGVFPLRGKPLNVRDASLKKIISCKEIQNIMKIMGLDIRKRNMPVDSLRYGHLMIMSDQDHDGSHIKGLIINFIHYYWPHLLQERGFLQQFITPIVKARKKGRNAEEYPISFFSMPDYFEWKASIGDKIKQYNIRYYKGLGTSGAKEGREYFERIDRHRLDFIRENEEDEKKIVMAFAKDKVEERKDWITHFKTNTNYNEAMDYTVRQVRYKDFIDKELILFSVADCERSIPSVVDGLKPGQRKIIFSCFKRSLYTRAIKVVQLAGYVSEHAAYHHGEQSLVQTIVSLAQDFVGSNNVPLLSQDGQFGTRHKGGKDHAAGRYIFTRLMDAARMIFSPADDFIVEYKDDDGLSVEPFFYVPVIPMVLVNGTSGIGTGFATNIPNYSPIEVIQNLQRLLRGEELLPMKPWYFGFNGRIEEVERGKFISRGVYEVRSNGVVWISELPIGTWTENYKQFLEDLREKEVLIQYREHNTNVTVDFELFIHPKVLEQWKNQDVVEERLQLREYIHATNIIAFNADGQLTKYADSGAVLKEFFHIRLDYYYKRKEYLLADLKRITSRLQNMMRFVSEVVAGTLVVTKRKRKDLLLELKSKGYAPFPPQPRKKMTATTIQATEGESEAAIADSADASSALTDLGAGDMEFMDGFDASDSADLQRASRDYDYLLGMKLWSLTDEMIERLRAQLQKASEETEALAGRTPESLWLEDLNTLEKQLYSYFHEREKETEGIQRKKMEKKKPFNVERLRVPAISEKALSVLMKEAIKIEKKTGRKAAGASNGELGDADDDFDGFFSGALGDAPKAGAAKGRKPSSKRQAGTKRKKKNSDDDDDDGGFDQSSDEDWLLDIGDDEDDDDDDGGNKKTSRGENRRVRKPRAASSPTGETKTSATKRTSRTNPSSSLKEQDDSAPPLQRTKRESKPVDKAGDFDLDSFGLDALMGFAPTTNSSSTTFSSPSALPQSYLSPDKNGDTTTTTTRTSPPPTSLTKTAAANTRNNNNNDDDDDLLLLGLASAPKTASSNTNANKSQAKRAPARPKAAPKATKRRRKGSSSESSSASHSDDSLLSSSAASSDSDISSSDGTESLDLSD